MNRRRPHPLRPVPRSHTTLKLGGPGARNARSASLACRKRGTEFAEFVPLDAGGPLTVQGLTGGQIDVGCLFTSDPAIATNGFVLLEDDKQLQLADNIVPVVRQGLDANPAVTDTANDHGAPHPGGAHQSQQGRDGRCPRPRPRPPSGSPPSVSASSGLEGDIVVGSTFYEQEILGEIFAQILESNGATVEREFQLGNREIVFPALESGEIDILAEYAATALEFVNEGAGQATTDPAATTARSGQPSSRRARPRSTTRRRTRTASSSPRPRPTNSAAKISDRRTLPRRRPEPRETIEPPAPPRVRVQVVGADVRRRLTMSTGTSDSTDVRAIRPPTAYGVP